MRQFKAFVLICGTWLVTILIVSGLNPRLGNGDSDESTPIAESNDFSPAVTSIRMPCADRESVEADIVRALNRSNEPAMHEPFAREYVATLEPETPVDQIFADGVFVNVRVKSGYHTGRYCWVVGQGLR